MAVALLVPLVSPMDICAQTPPAPTPPGGGLVGIGTPISGNVNSMNLGAPPPSAPKQPPPTPTTAPTPTPTTAPKPKPKPKPRVTISTKNGIQPRIVRQSPRMQVKSGKRQSANISQGQRMSLRIKLPLPPTVTPRGGYMHVPLSRIIIFTGSKGSAATPSKPPPKPTPGGGSTGGGAVTVQPVSGTGGGTQTTPVLPATGGGGIPPSAVGKPAPTPR